MVKRSQKCERFLVRLSRLIFKFLDFLCAFLEMHLVKIVSFSIMALCCTMVNSLHMVVVIALVFCSLLKVPAARFSFSLIGPFLGFLFLFKMTYQTKFISKVENTLNCSDANITFSSVMLYTILDPVWWGFEILNAPLADYYKGYVIVFGIMTLQTVIHTRQKIARIDAKQNPETPPVLFLETTRKDADSGLKECFKYLINYGFYKFGVEVTMSFCVILISIRSDVFSLLYAVWLFALFLPRKNCLPRLWPFFLTTVLISVLWQYAVAVHISPKACYDYPWADEKNFSKWLFLPNFTYKPDTMKTLGDFVLFLFIQKQRGVFEVESKYADSFLGGSNNEVYKSFDNPNAINPTPNHTLNFKSWMNLAKFVFMTSFYRITLAFLFCNGASNIGILTLGYLVAAFVFFWLDYDLCLWPINKIITWWNILLGFIICVILSKALIECAGCLKEVYVKENLNWLIKLFCIGCHSSNNSRNSNFDWDVICFICVLFQRRFFKSYYFLHEKNDVLGMYLLQEKGAKLIDKLQEHKLKKFQEQERKTLTKIKKNMSRIKAWQKRMHGLNYNEPADHTTATYMGDYFMFQDLIDVPDKLDDSSSSSDELSENKSSSKHKLRDKESSKKKISKEKSKGKRKRTDLNRAEESDSKIHLSTVNLTEGKEKSKRKKCKMVLNECMLQLTCFFQKHSKDYHYVKLEIKRERKKQKFQARPPPKSSNDLIPSSGSEEEDDESSYYYYDYKERILKKGGKKYSSSSQKLFLNLLISVCMFIMSKTELVCYLIVFLRTTLSPGLISLPVPLLVFLWGSLTNVRPTKTFWTVLIAYIEVSVVIKALFQISIFPWNKPGSNIPSSPKNAPLFIGIHQTSTYVLADLFLLLVLFLHRHELKSLGLWNRAHEEETFPPQDLHVYRELYTEENVKQIKANRSAVYLRKILIADPLDKRGSITEFLRVALWKCTSRATAKITYRGKKRKIKTRVKEMEGKILVTHEGRRLEPTFLHVSRIPENEMEGALVLRVYVKHIPEAKDLPYRLSWVQHFTPIRKFFLQILVRDWRVSADFYTPMFIFQFLAFLIVFFGYSSFSNPVIVAEDYFSLLENQIPFMYLFTVITHFLTIIIDRVLYLRKCVIGKLILQYALVILVHVWMFIIIPIATESSFSNLRTPQTYYMIVCFYFLMSAFQLRVGYPLRVQGHFLCKKYKYFNYYAYKGLQLIPFFNQLRTILDYLCTHSSFTLSEWIKMENIFELVFENKFFVMDLELKIVIMSENLKCSRRADIFYPSPRGEECPKSSKYCPGLVTLSGSVVVIWLPFIIFAFFNSIANPNVPQEASLQIHIENFGELYSAKAKFHDIFSFTKDQYEKFLAMFKDNRKVWTYLVLYDHKDVGVIKFRTEPIYPWIITPFQLSLLNKTIQNNDNPISFYVSYTIKRTPQSQIIPTAKGHSEVILKKGDHARKQLRDIFLGKTNTLILKNVLPKFIHVTNLGKAKVIEGFLSSQYRMHSHRSLKLTLMKEGRYKWWKVEEIFNETTDETLDRIPYENHKEIVLYTFNQKNVPSILQSIKRKGIIGLYLSIVIFTWSLIRRLMKKYPYIMYTDMPNPDPLLRLCHDIYLARESHEFALEEDLYAKLLFLFRSPETLVKVTRLESNLENP